MQCAKCGLENPEGAVECQRCGINLDWAAHNITESCPTCGAVNPASALKCNNCGLNLEWERQQRRQGESAVSPVAAGRGVAPASLQTESVRAKEKARRQANTALICAIVGMVFLGLVLILGYSTVTRRPLGSLLLAPVLILASVAIAQARPARKVLQPGEDGYARSVAGEVIGWVLAGLWLVIVCAVPLVPILTGRVRFRFR